MAGLLKRTSCLIQLHKPHIKLCSNSRSLKYSMDSAVALSVVMYAYIERIGCSILSLSWAFWPSLITANYLNGAVSKSIYMVGMLIWFYYDQIITFAIQYHAARIALNFSNKQKHHYYSLVYMLWNIIPMQTSSSLLHGVFHWISQVNAFMGKQPKQPR